jgi:hypothetical protein
MISQQYKTISTNKRIEQAEEAIKELMKNAILMNIRLKELEKPWYHKIKDKISINHNHKKNIPEIVQETGQNNDLQQ